jgi:hypothetical protein
MDNKKVPEPPSGRSSQTPARAAYPNRPPPTDYPRDTPGRSHNPPEYPDTPPDPHPAPDYPDTPPDPYGPNYYPHYPGGEGQPDDGPPEIDQGPDPNAGRPSCSPFLVVRLVPPSARFWENQSITTSAAPQEGVPTTVSVKILNQGSLAAIDVVVDFRWGNPTLGLSEAQLHRIGVRKGVLIRSQEEKTISCPVPWTPVLENGGHECLMVTCWALNDRTGPIHAWQPQTERRCGQLNVGVAPLVAGAQQRVSLEMANLLPLRAVHTVLASVDRLSAQSRALAGASQAEMRARVLSAGSETTRARSVTAVGTSRTQALAAAREEFAVRPGALAIRSRLSEGLGIIGSAGASRALATRLLEADRLQASTRLAAVSGMSILHETNLHPFELRRVELELEAPSDARPGEFIVYRLAQVAEGLLLGGYTFIVQVESHGYEPHTTKPTQY